MYFIMLDSDNQIEFLHGNKLRWSIGDYYYVDFLDSYTSSFFGIKYNGTNSTIIPFSINEGSNIVNVGNLQISSFSGEQNNGRNLKISTEGNVIAAPNQFLSFGAMDITTLGTGTVTREFAGSFGPNATAQVIYVPIHLPDGSKFVGFTVTYLDTSPNASLQVSLHSRTVTASTTIATVTSTNINSSSVGTMNPTVLSGTLTLDNQARQYYFEIKPRNQANTAAGNWDASLLKIVKIVLEYQ